jgi:hypothetical protein
LGQVHTLNIQNPTTFTDGTAFADTTDTAGYEISIDGAAAVSIPVGYVTSFDMSTLAVWPTLKTGPHTVTLAVVTKEGVTGLYAAPLTFPILGVPVAPTLLSVT